MNTRILPALLLAGVAVAQTPPCISANDANNSSNGALTAFSFAGPNVYAWQFLPTQAVTLQALEIYTENAFVTDRGFMTLEIYDSNLIFQPGSRLAGGTFEVDPNLGHDWHGTNLDFPTTVVPGQTYWIVWREPGFSEIPSESGGQIATTARFTGGTWNTLASGWAPKWRGYCGFLDQANVQPVGFGCQGSGSAFPSIFTNYAPTVGNVDFQLEASGFAAAVPGLIIFGVDPNWTSQLIPIAPPGCELHTDALVTATVMTGSGDEGANHQPAGPGFAGHASYPFAIPNNASLAGSFLAAQFAALDLASGAALPFILSNGLRFTVQ